MLADLVAFEVVAVKILGEAVRHVHAEAVRTMVEPEAQRLDEVGAHLGVLPVPVRLLLGEHVQIPLAVRNARPRRTAEACDPISRRLVAVRALAVAEDVTVAFPGEPGAAARAALNHSCRLELWFGTMSTTTLMPCSWAALASSSKSSMVPSFGSTLR